VVLHVSALRFLYVRVLKRGDIKEDLPYPEQRKRLPTRTWPVRVKSVATGDQMAKHSSHILDMARKGAEHRYNELKAEIALLVKHFPHLATRTGGIVSQAVAAPRKRRKMSAAARKAVSERMKKYWAARRKAKK
jgi:hypothetical protein